MVKKIIYSFLLVILCIGAYMLGFYLFKPNEVVLDDVSLKDVEVEETSKGSSMAIMIGDKEGNYSTYTETGFPNNKLYRFNNEKSGCVDARGNTVSNALSYDDSLSKISLRTTQSVSCYLYFDFIPEPTVTVTLNETDALNVTTTILSDKDGTYCINKSSDSNTPCLASGSITANESVITDKFAVSGTYYVHVEDEVEQVGHSSAVNVNLIYNQIEYIEGTGTQYINTGYIPNQDSRIILDFENTYTGTVNLALCGARISTTDSVFGIWIRGQNLVYPHYGNTSYSTITVNINTAQRLTYEMNSNQSKVGDINNTATAATFSSTYPLTIFAMNSGGTVDNSRVSVGKLYSTKLYDSGTMVRDLYPVVRISDNEVGLYDKVNNVFYTNTGTGDFVGGEVIEIEGIGASSKVVINNGDVYSINKTVTLDIYSSSASSMCISENTSCTDYVDYSTSSSYTFSSDGTKILYVTFKDSLGNIIETLNDNIIVDTVVPTVTTSVSNNNSTSAKMTITSSEDGTYCVNTSSDVENMENCVFSGNITADSTITTTAFTSSGTYYAHVQDGVGNIGISSKVSITVGNPFGTYLLSNSLKGKTARSGLYRYTGTSANNYVSIGGVLYRVIGVTDGSTTNTSLGLTANQVKLIKAESIGSYTWHDSESVNARWNVSGYTKAALYTTLQGSTILGSSSVIPSAWTSKISSVKWYVGDVSTQTPANASTVFGYEDNAKTQSNAKVGLIYMSDYYYSVNDGGTTDCWNTACSSWMKLGSNEWTMSRYGVNGIGNYIAWGVSSNGNLGLWGVSSTRAVRPVFYLSTSVNYVSGTGKSGDPYIIS